MKTSEVLKRYANGERDFRAVSLRGQSFKGKDLSGADFSNADIRGTDFTNAILKYASFKYAKAGMQSCWAAVFIAVSLLLSALSALASWNTGVIASETLFKSSDPLGGVIPSVENDISSMIVFVVLAIFCLATIRQGFTTALVGVAGIGAGLVAVLEVVFGAMYGADGLNAVGAGAWRAAGAGIWALAGALTGALAVFSSTFETKALTLTLAVLKIVSGVSAIVTAAFIFKASEEEPTALAFPALPVTMVVLIAVVLLGSYAGWRAIAGDEKFASIRRFAIALAAARGTSFRSADLTEVDFTNAMLTSTDLRANLTRTCFYNAKKLEQTRFEGTYLENPKVQQLVVTLAGQNKNFDRFNLRGINLVRANLADASFIGADLSEAKLQDADLSRAKLVQTQLEETDLTGATLTGATIEDWGITSHTKLYGVRCEYVFMRLATKEDPNPRRKPDNWEEKFEDGEFADFITPILKTLDFYHNQQINPRAIAIAYRQLKENYPEADLQIVAMEIRGKNKDKFLLRVETSEEANHSELNAEYFKNYNQIKTLPSDHLLLLLAEKDNQISRLEKMIGAALSSYPLETGSQVCRQQNKLVFLIIGSRDSTKGFPAVLAQIWVEGFKFLASCQGSLPLDTEISKVYKQWKRIYEYQSCVSRQLKRPKDHLTNISPSQLNQVGKELQKLLKTWLDSEGFRKIADTLREKLTETDSVRVIIQTEDIGLQCLPWHLWQFFETYLLAEVALSLPSGVSVTKSRPSRTQVRILAILGNSEGIDVEEDRRVLQNLPSAETQFLVEPRRAELDKYLWNEQGWDILCFSGHSESTADASIGVININKNEQLTIENLRNALRKAIKGGLHLAIFNSCDGLGLARQLADLHIPQVIVMREPVPDLVAQEFLKNFLQAFSNGKSLYLSVREAREKLQAMEDKFPYASWLPVIYQNSAEVPKTWKEFIYTNDC